MGLGTNKHATGQLLTDFIFQGLICLPQQSDDPTLIRTNCLLEVSDDLESQSPQNIPNANGILPKV